MQAFMPPAQRDNASAKPIEESQILIGTVVGLVERMLACATAGDWDQVASLERERQPLMAVLQAKYPPGTLGLGAKPGFERLQRAHARILALGEAARGQLRLSLRQINKGRRAQQVYEGE